MILGIAPILIIKQGLRDLLAGPTPRARFGTHSPLKPPFVEGAWQKATTLRTVFRAQDSKNRDRE
jgi:hypothetical protein